MRSGKWGRKKVGNGEENQNSSASKKAGEKRPKNTEE